MIYLQILLFFSYVEFDFHNQTKKKNGYENLKHLIDEVQKDTKEFGYFWVNTKTGEIKKKQNGVLRVNCIDCLDRTNVVEVLVTSII